MKYILSGLLFVLSTAASTMSTAQAGEYYNGIRVDAIVDVRTPIEYAEGHLVGAINIPIGWIGMGIQSVKGITKDSTILVYCRTGIRATRARDLLMLQGYTRVLNGGTFSTLAETMASCMRPNCETAN